jgi:hypothetical protein
VLRAAGIVSARPSTRALVPLLGLPVCDPRPVSIDLRRFRSFVVLLASGRTANVTGINAVIDGGLSKTT